MGFLDRLFGVKPHPSKEAEVPSPAADTAEEAATADTSAAETATATAEETAAETEETTAPAEEATPMEETAPAAEETAPAPVTPAAENASAEEDTPPWGAHLQKRLDTYFARLRQEFPDGRIVRLNTGHKKLAERGAELRRLIGYEGRLDDFFALGGFTYQRSVGGRPSLPAAQTASVEERLRTLFPDDVPTVLAVQQADHRLYLDLRAAARRADCTVGTYLEQFKA